MSACPGAVDGDLMAASLLLEQGRHDALRGRGPADVSEADKTKADHDRDATDF